MPYRRTENMKDYNWNFTLTESFLETLKEVNKIQLSTSVLAISQALKDVVPNYNPDAIKSAMSEIVATQKVWREAVLPLRSVSEMIASAYPTLKMDSTAMAQSILSQVDTSTLRALRESVSLAVLAKADWSWLSEVHTEETTDDEHNAASNFDLGLRILGCCQYTPLDFRDLGTVLLVLPLGNTFGMLHSCQIVYILQETIKAGSVAGGQIFISSRIFHILDTEAAQSAAPMSFCVGIVLSDNALVHRQSLIEFANTAEMIAPVKGSCPLVIVDLRQCHGTAAEFACTKGLVGGQFNIATTHFTFDNCHIKPLFCVTQTFTIFASGFRNAIISQRHLNLHTSHTALCPHYFVGMNSGWNS